MLIIDILKSYKLIVRMRPYTKVLPIFLIVFWTKFTVPWKDFCSLTVYLIFLHIYHTWMIQIIKLILYYTQITQVNTYWVFEIISFIKRKKLSKPAWHYVKNNCPLNLIIGCATFCSNSCNQAFAITGNESFTSLWRIFGHLFFAELF